MTDSTPSPVRRRRVLYIPGYDPFPPRRYRELYRREGAEQAGLSGYTLSQSKGDTPHSWKVEARMDGFETASEIEVLVWSDIVASSMSASIPATYGQLVRTAWTYIGSGALLCLMRLRMGPVIAALYPILVLLAQLVAAVGIGLLAGWTVGWILPGVVGIALGAVVAGGACWGILRWFKSVDARIFAHYLMHDYAFSAHLNGANPPELEARMAAFGDRIVGAMATEVDEVLVIGHSSGAHLAISVLADLVRDGRVSPGKLSFLSLGHVVPMMSFLPDAARLRSDLHVMGGQEVIPWVDVTAPGDGGSFALCDPVAVTGVAPARQTGPLVISAAFRKTLTADKLRSFRRRFFRLHFQYLCAFDNLPGKIGDYDYFRITAGPMRLGERFAGRRPSPSRRTDAVSGYRAMAA